MVSGTLPFTELIGLASFTYTGVTTCLTLLWSHLKACSTSLHLVMARGMRCLDPSLLSLIWPPVS